MRIFITRLIALEMMLLGLGICPGSGLGPGVPLFAADRVELRMAELERMQLAHCAGSWNPWKFFREFGKSMLTGGALIGASSIAASRCTTYLLGEEGVQGNQLMASSLQSAICAGINSAVLSAVHAASKCRTTPEESVSNLYLKIVQESRRSVESLPDSFKNQIHGIDLRVANDLRSPTEMGSTRILNALRRRELVYRLWSHHPKDISSHSTEMSDAEKSAMQTNILSLLERFSGNPEESNELEILIDQIRENSSWTNGTVKPKKIQFYLFGPPGTGKTSFVRKLAETLHLYACEISVRDLRPKDLNGSGYPLDPYFSVADEHLLGKLGECYRRAGHTNFILFFDELGELLGESDADVDRPVEVPFESDEKRELKGQLKKFLDLSTRTIPFDGLGIDGDFSRAIVIGAGNRPLADSSFLEKLSEVRFLQLDPKRKAVALREGYEESLARIKGQVSEQRYQKIKVLADSYLGEILKQDQKLFPGGRVIKEVVDEWVVYVKNRTQTEGAITPNQAKKFIDRAFSRRVRMAIPEAI